MNGTFYTKHVKIKTAVKMDISIIKKPQVIKHVYFFISSVLCIGQEKMKNVTVTGLS